MYEIYHGAENEIISELISETDFSAMLSTSISSVNYVKWMYVYANLGVQLYKEITNRFKRSRTLDYNLQSTKLSITDFNRALTPYLNDTDSQAQVLENVYDYLSGLIHDG